MRFALIRSTFVLFSLATALAIASASAAEQPKVNELSDIERMLIERDCIALSNSYGHAIDFSDPDLMASLFAADGRWLPSGGSAQGPKAIHDYLARQVGRPYVTRHVLTNTRIEVIDRDHAKGTAYLTMYRYDPAHPESIKTLSPALVGVLTDEYVRTSQGWRFQLRKLDRVRPAD
jgi:SnoaL-like protein